MARGAKGNLTMQTLDKKSPVTVTPVRWVEHKRLSDLVAIKGRKNFYVNLISGKITYKRKDVKIATGQTKILAAEKIVEEQLELMRTGKSRTEVRRQMTGVIHPGLSSLWTEIIANKRAGRAKATVATWEKNWNVVLKNFWGDLTTVAITPRKIDEFAKWYLESFPKRLSKKTMVHFAALVRYAYTHKYISEMPNLQALYDVEGQVKANKQYKKAGRVLSGKETEMILAGCEKYREKAFEDYQHNHADDDHREMLYLRAKLAITIAGKGGGCRKMEILSMQWAKVDFATHQFEVYSTKNKAWREIPMTKEVEELLIQLRPYTSHSKWVFPRISDPTKHIHSQIFDKVWRQVRTLSGVQGRVRFHDLRHTFATMTAEEGWPPVVACTILDMTLAIYQATYCKPSTRSKHDWMRG